MVIRKYSIAVGDKLIVLDGGRFYARESKVHPGTEVIITKLYDDGNEVIFETQCGRSGYLYLEHAKRGKFLNYFKIINNNSILYEVYGY